MKHISVSYEWKWCHVCGDCFIRVHTNGREVLSVGEPKPRGHIQQDLFFLWKVFSTKRHTHEGGTKQLKPPPTPPPKEFCSSQSAGPERQSLAEEQGSTAVHKALPFPPKIAAINPKTLWPQANYEAANLPSAPCLHDVSQQLPYSNFLHKNIPGSMKMVRQTEAWQLKPKCNTNKVLWSLKTLHCAHKIPVKTLYFRPRIQTGSLVSGKSSYSNLRVS